MRDRATEEHDIFFDVEVFFVKSNDVVMSN